MVARVVGDGILTMASKRLISFFKWSIVISQLFFCSENQVLDLWMGVITDLGAQLYCCSLGPGLAEVFVFHPLLLVGNLHSEQAPGA